MKTTYLASLFSFLLFSYQATVLGQDPEMLEAINHEFIVEKASVIKYDLKMGVAGKLVHLQGIAYVEGG